MSRPRRRAPAASPHRYPRTARLNESLREVIADELTRLDDERLDLVTITSVDVDQEMNRATVYFDSLVGADGDAAILAVLAEHRVRIQGSIGRQVRAKKTPIITFRPDESIRAAERIDQLLRDAPPIVRADPEADAVVADIEADREPADPEPDGDGPA